jgi:regulator of sigma E protease
MISVLVVAHEWGHFIVARIFKIRVDDFSVGFGPRVVRIGKLGDTEYNIRAFPLGGFVKIAGMDPDEEPLIKAREALSGQSATPGEAIEVEPQSTEDQFYSKPIWQRALVILAGPVMSLLFGVMVFCVLGFTVGIASGPATSKIAEVYPGGQAFKVGLRSGDVIQMINNQPIKDGAGMVDIIHQSYNEPLTLVVSRNGKILTFQCKPMLFTDPETDTPQYAETVVNPGLFSSSGLQAGDVIYQVGDEPVIDVKTFQSELQKSVGKTAKLLIWRNKKEATVTVPVTLALAAKPPLTTDYKMGMLKFVPQQAIKRLSVIESTKFGFGLTAAIFENIAGMFQHHQIKQLKESTGGIVMMYSVTGLAVKNGMSSVLMTAGELSISLGIFNLFPIPVLDGGHLLTFFIEWVRRGRRLSEQQQQIFLITGVLVIGTLFALIFTNDIHRLISHQVPQ